MSPDSVVGRGSDTRILRLLERARRSPRSLFTELKTTASSQGVLLHGIVNHSSFGPDILWGFFEGIGILYNPEDKVFRVSDDDPEAEVRKNCSHKLLTQIEDNIRQNPTLPESLEAVVVRQTFPRILKERDIPESPLSFERQRRAIQTKFFSREIDKTTYIDEMLTLTASYSLNFTTRQNGVETRQIAEGALGNIRNSSIDIQGVMGRIGSLTQELRGICFSPGFDEDKVGFFEEVLRNSLLH